MLRRHFFLVFAVAVLTVMVIAGGWKLATGRSAGAGGPGAGGPPGAAGGPGGAGGGAGGARGAAGGRFGAFGGGGQVAATTIQPHVFTDAIEVLGVAKGRRSVTLTAAATQLVDRVRFTDGQSVGQGAVLVELKATEQTAGVAQSQARLVQAQREYERWKTLGEKGFASKSSIDQYQAAYISAQADLKAAQAREGDRLIRAPFAGVVGLSDVAPGALVNPGAPIVTLDDLSAIRVDFPVPEQYLAQLHEGQAIQAEVDAYPGEQISGRIAKLDTRVDERTRAITARAEFPNPGRRLKPGMLMRVAISRGTRTSLAAPEPAVAVQGDSAFVFVLHPMPAGAQGQGQGQQGQQRQRQQGQQSQAGGAGQRAGQGGPRMTTEQRPVVTGLRQNGFVEITDGATAGERIVADGLNKIQAGQPVRVVPGGGRPGGGPGGGGAGAQGGGQGGDAAAAGGFGGRRGPGAGAPGAGGAGAYGGGQRPGGPGGAPGGYQGGQRQGGGQGAGPGGGFRRQGAGGAAGEAQGRPS